MPNGSKSANVRPVLGGQQIRLKVLPRIFLVVLLLLSNIE